MAKTAKAATKKAAKKAPKAEKKSKDKPKAKSEKTKDKVHDKKTEKSSKTPLINDNVVVVKAKNGFVIHIDGIQFVAPDAERALHRIGQALGVKG